MGYGCVPTNRASAEHYQWGGPQGNGLRRLAPGADTGAECD